MFKKLPVVMVLFVMISSAYAEPIVTDSTSRSTVDSNSTSIVKSPPPSAISPSVTNINNDLCAVGYGGAAQTQILGISFGGTSRDFNCERLKLSKTLYDMGMKVAAVATLCQDRRIFDAMMSAGTPCPINGKIGAEAKEIWESTPSLIPELVKEK